MTDGRLRFPQGILEVARADLVRRGHQAQQPKPHRVGQGGEHTGKLCGLVVGQRGSHQGRAAHALVELDHSDALAGHPCLRVLTPCIDTMY